MKYTDIMIMSYSDINEYEKAKSLNCMMLNDKLEEDYTIKCIEGKFDLGIVKARRGLGYGRRILETAIQHLAEKNLEVELIVLEPNTVAYEMYKKRGFEIRSTMGHWIRL